jgi:hypothetical protein
MRNNNNKYIFEFVLLSIVILTFDVLLSKYSFPLTEGWWEAYSWIGKEKNLYQEVNLSFPPLFILIQGIVLKFTDNFLIIRILYSFIHIFEFYLLTKTVGLFFDKKYAIIGAFIAEVLMIIKNPVWIVKDYHLIISILELMVIILTFKIYRIKNGFNIINQIILSFIFTLIILLKQNVALIIISTSLLTFFLAFKSRKLISYNILTIAIFTGLFVNIFSYFYGYKWINTYLQNDSKGELSTVFLRILQEPSARNILLSALVIYVLIIIISLIYENFIKDFIDNKRLIFIKKLDENNINRLRLNFTYALFIYALIGTIFFIDVRFLYIIIISFVLYKLHLYRIFNASVNQYNEYSYLILAGIIYTGTMTAGFNSVSMELPTAFFVAFLLRAIYVNTAWTGILMLSASVIFSIYGFYASKVKSNSYDWWGYSVSSVLDAKYESSHKKLAGISFDKNTQEILNKTSLFMQDKNSTLLSYPSIPIFYYLYQKLPIISSPVLWFDVYSSKNIKNDLQLLKEHNPDYIFWLRPAHYAYEGHSNMKASKLPLMSFDDYIANLVENRIYKVVYIKPILGGNDIDGINIYKKNILSPITSEFNCKQCSEILLDQMDNNNGILKYEFNKYPGKINVKFKNIYYLADFIEENYLAPIKTDMNIFFILERVK